MADLTFKGTTQQVLAEIASVTSVIDSNTKITITDNLYTAANLLYIVGTSTNYPVTLVKTAAAVALVDTDTNLKIILNGVNKYTGPVTATNLAGSSSADDINEIASLTTGKVTATLAPATPIDQDTVADLRDVKATDNITFAPTVGITLSGNAEINALISLNKILKTDFSGLAASIINGGGNDVAVIKQALTILKDSAGVAVNIAAVNPISAADANALAKATIGDVTATLKPGSVAATLKALTDVSATDALAFTTTDTSAKASDIVALSAKLVGGAFTSATVTTITGAANEVATITAALTALTRTEDVNVSGTITATQAETIKGVTSGDITATIAADTAANLAAKLTSTTTTDMLDLTVNGTTAAAVDLAGAAGLITLTGGKIKLEATNVTGDLSEVQDLYITNKAQFTNLGNENVTIITDTPSTTDLNAIAAATTGKVTATLNPATPLTAATVTALKDVKTSDNITFAPTAGTLTDKASMNALLAIKKILPNADLSAVADIAAADEKDVALVKNVLKLINPTSDVDFATGKISAKDANDIAKVISGALKATIKDGGIAATLKALSDIDVTTDSDDLTFKTTDTTAKASDIVALDALILTPANLDLSKVKTITGTSAETDAVTGAIPAALTVLGVGTAVEVKITGTVDGADIKAIIDATTGKVTATLAADDASTLAAALADTEVNNIAVTVDDSAATDLATDLTLLAAATSAKVKVDSADVSGTFAQLNQVYVTDKSRFTALGNEDITVTVADSALNIDVLAKATTGVLTATVSDATANILVSQLKNANAKDDLTIVVLNNAAGTSAKDLLALTKKTALQIDATAVTSTVSGTAAEINNLIKAESLPGTKYVDLGASPVYNVSGTVKAADANAIALTTGGAVTATIAADTAEKLNAALIDAGNTYKLTVNGATASQADLASLATTAGAAGEIKVDAKEITVDNASIAALATIYATPGTVWKNLGNENVKLTDAVSIANLASLNGILGKTTGVVTASASGTAAALNAGLTSATAKDALTLTVNNAVGTTAADLLGLDDKTSVKVDAKLVTGVTGSAVELKKLAAAKGVELAKDVNITLSDTTVKAADLGAILKATTGVVTADVTADTAAKLSAALKDANSSDALTLSVNGVTAAAKDLISLTGKTDTAAARISLNVGAITGNIADITSVFTNTTDFVVADLGAAAATITGTVTAAQADAIADETTGVVTATIAADTAANLLSDLTNTTGGLDKLKLTVNGTTAGAKDLTDLDALTAETVNASAIINIDGTTNVANGATEVKAAYDAAKAGRISGLGNETVDLTGVTDANVALVKAINDYTTGVITLDTLTFSGATTFNLANSLGDLKGITGLVKIDAETNPGADTINISLNDILAANDGKTFAFDINNEAGDKINLNISGWTHDSSDTTYDSKIYTKGDVTITLNIKDVTDPTDLVIVA